MRKFLFLAGLVVASCAVPGASTDFPAPRLIILISIDTMRGDAFHAIAPSGRPSNTPNLDRLARRSVVFDRAYAQASWTLPSHASMLTSLYPVAHKASLVPDDASAASMHGMVSQAPRLAEILAAHGYLTQGFYTNDLLDPKFGFAKGFPRYESAGDRYANKGGETVFDRALLGLERCRGRKCFLFVHTNMVHNYLIMAPKEGTGAGFQCPFRIIPWDEAAHPQPKNSDDPYCGKVRADYAHAVYCEDRELDWFLRQVAGIEKGAPALIIVTSDHGEGLCARHGQKLIVSHAGVGYDDQIHVPLLIQLPGEAAAGKRIHALAETIDIPPTILELAGIPSPPVFQGKSLVPVMLGKTGRLHQAVFAEGQDWRSVRTERYKYIQSAEGAAELYDLRQDDGEAGDAAGLYPQKLLEMRGILREFLAHEAVFPAATPPSVDTESAREALRAEGYLK